MGARSRSLFRWALGTLVFGSAFLLLDVAMFHFWHLRRRTAPPEWHLWHLRIAASTGAAALLLTFVGVRLLRRWKVLGSRKPPESGDRTVPPES